MGATQFSLFCGHLSWEPSVRSIDTPPGQLVIVAVAAPAHVVALASAFQVTPFGLLSTAGVCLPVPVLALLNSHSLYIFVRIDLALLMRASSLREVN